MKNKFNAEFFYLMSSPEIGWHLFHTNARCISSGVLYFSDICGLRTF